MTTTTRTARKMGILLQGLGAKITALAAVAMSGAKAAAKAARAAAKAVAKAAGAEAVQRAVTPRKRLTWP